MIGAYDVVVAIVDGPDADSGTCVEIGYAYALKNSIIGVRTDLRASEDRGVNLMVSHAFEVLIRSGGSTPDLAAALGRTIAGMAVQAGRLGSSDG